MPLSDAAKIILIVCSSVSFFAVIFGIALILRYYSTKRGTSQLPIPVFIKTPRASKPSGREQCDCNSTPDVRQQDACGASIESILVEPHFTEKTVSIRRISMDASRPDTIQRVNSVVSTMLTDDDLSSALLPYGGRKSSIGSNITVIESSRLLKLPGIMDLDGRRISVLTNSGDRHMSLRRVSPGGKEDVVLINGGSVDLAAASQIALFGGSTASEDVTPRISHIPLSQTGERSSALDFATGTFSIPEGMKESSRPNSRTPKALDTSTSTVQATTATSIMGIKSPSIAAYTHDSTSSFFNAWNGFPLGSGVTERGTDLQVELSPWEIPFPVSPKTPLTAQPTPTPYTATIASTSPFRDTIPTTRLSVPPSTLSRPLSVASGKVIYLADVVKEEEDKRSSDPPIIPLPDGLKGDSDWESTVLIGIAS